MKLRSKIHVFLDPLVQSFTLPKEATHNVCDLYVDPLLLKRNFFPSFFIMAMKGNQDSLNLVVVICVWWWWIHSYNVLPSSSVINSHHS